MRFDGTADMDAKEYVGMEWDRHVKGNTNKLHQSVFREKLLKDFGYLQTQETVEGYRILADASHSDIGYSQTRLTEMM